MLAVRGRLVSFAAVLRVVTQPAAKETKGTEASSQVAQRTKCFNSLSTSVFVYNIRKSPLFLSQSQNSCYFSEMSVIYNQTSDMLCFPVCLEYFSTNIIIYGSCHSYL